MTRLTYLLAASTLLALASPALADNTELRIATLAPSGSPWMEVLGKGQTEVHDKTAGRLSIKYYEGGQQGDERDFVRKIGLGQLDGAAVTSVGLSMIDPSIRVLELPMMFQSPEEVDYVTDKMWPYFQKKFEKKGYRLSERGEVGWLFVLSKDKVDSVAALKKQKLWLWTDDTILSAFDKKLGANTVPLGVPEVDAALTSGKVDDVVASPIAAVALQWFSKVKYMTEKPVSFGIAATVISTKALAKLSAADAKSLEDINKATQKKLRKVIRKSNEEAKTLMLHRGVTVVPTPAAMVTDLDTNAQAMWTELTDKVYSKDELAMVLKYRDDFRARKAAKK